MQVLTFEARAPSEAVQPFKGRPKGDRELDALGVKEQIAMVLEEMGYRDIKCTGVKVVRPEQIRMNEK